MSPHGRARIELVFYALLARDRPRTPDPGPRRPYVGSQAAQDVIDAFRAERRAALPGPRSGPRP